MFFGGSRTPLTLITCCREPGSVGYLLSENQR
jgi:hypothetical protein